jgi:hypothetical protein
MDNVIPVIRLLKNREEPEFRMRFSVCIEILFTEVLFLEKIIL